MKYKKNLFIGKQTAGGENGSWTFRDREPGPVLHSSGTSMEILHYMHVFFSFQKISYSNHQAKILGDIATRWYSLLYEKILIFILWKKPEKITIF